MEKINNKEAIALAVSCNLQITVLVASQIIASTCLSSSLINTGYISIIAMILSIFICVLYKKFIGVSFLDITEYLGGKILKFIVGVIFFLYFLFTASIVLCKTVNCLQIVYYPMTNISYTVLLFVITTCIVCNLKNNGFVRSTFLVIPFAFFAVFLTFIGNLKNFNYENIFPILGNGINTTFISGTSHLFTFGSLAYILFLPQHLKKPEKFMTISLVSMVFSSILLSLVISTIILMFNRNVTSGQLFPLYISVRYIEYGTFFQRLDSAFLLILNIAICSFLGIYAKMCLEILTDITGITDSKPISFSFALLLYASTIYIDSFLDLEIIQDTVFKIIFFISVGVGFVILIFSNLKKLLLERSTR